MSTSKDTRLFIQKALSMLNIEHLSLGIFEQSLPAFAQEETGRGSLYSNGANGFFAFVKNLGFNTIQLGPHGKTSRYDPSPYNSTIFSKNPLSLSLFKLSETFPEILPKELLPLPCHQYPDKVSNVNYTRVWDCFGKYTTLLYQNFIEHQSSPLVSFFSDYKNTVIQNDFNWLERDATYNIFSTLYKTEDWQLWPGPDKYLYHQKIETSKNRINEIRNQYRNQYDQYAFVQFLLDHQHSVFRTEMADLGLKVYGDLQIGFSHQDIWSYKKLFMPSYLMGAPPSRSNPEGQPWGYPVLNPSLFFSNGNYGPALQLMKARIDSMFSDYDGIRIDHPHGLVCPWVYKSADPDSLHAVQNGSRLYSSPDKYGHEELAQYSIVTRSQLNDVPSYPPYGDDWVKDLTTEQVDKYATIIDLIIQRAEYHGADKSDILCEVLSTWPYPLKRVMQSRKLGRFCITQKADPINSADIYRRENTEAKDWIMPGNHDTKPIWLIAAENFRSPWYYARTGILANQFGHSEIEINSLKEAMMNDRNLFCLYMFAELFLGPARHVYIFFSDLFGLHQIFNRPGFIHPDNWSLRLPSDFVSFYTQKVRKNEACNLPAVLALALKARFPENDDAKALAERLRLDTPAP